MLVVLYDTFVRFIRILWIIEIITLNRILPQNADHDGQTAHVRPMHTWPLRRPGQLFARLRHSHEVRYLESVDYGK